MAGIHATLPPERSVPTAQGGGRPAPSDYAEPPPRPPAAARRRRGRDRTARPRVHATLSGTSTRSGSPTLLGRLSWARFVTVSEQSVVSPADHPSCVVQGGLSHWRGPKTIPLHDRPVA